MAVLYLDELLLTNFLLAAALLLSAGVLGGARCSGGRLLAGAGLGAAACLILLAPRLPFGAALGYKALTGALAVGAAYGVGSVRRFARLCGWFLLANLCLAGLAAACILRGVRGLAAGNLTVSLSVPPGLLLLCCGGCYALLRGMSLCFGRPQPCRRPFTLRLGGRELRLEGFFDTGCRLEDPLGLPVVLVRYGAVRPRLAPALRRFLDGQPGLIHYYNGESAALPPPGVPLRYLPCRTVAGGGLCPALPAELVGKKGNIRVLAALCEGEADDWSLLYGERLAEELEINKMGGTVHETAAPAGGAAAPPAPDPTGGLSLGEPEPAPAPDPGGGAPPAGRDGAGKRRRPG